MSVTSNIRKAGPYTGNGITTSYPFAFKVFNTSEVLVVQTDVAGNETTLALTADYTVTLNTDQDANPGGTVDMLVAPAVGLLITLTSSVDETQSVTLTNQGGFYPTVINDALDRLTIITQQILESLGRKIGYGVSDTTTDVIPAASERANKFLAFDSNGNVVASAVSVGTIPSSIVSDLVTMRAGTVTNGEIVNLKYHTTSGAGGGGRFRGVTGAAPGAYIDNNGTIIVPTGGDGSAAWLREDVGYVTPRMFGATGDGVTDDTAAIQAAFASGVLHVHFPSGTYLLNAAITCAAGQVITGDGKLNSTIKCRNDLSNITFLTLTGHSAMRDIALIGYNSTAGTALNISSGVYTFSAHTRIERVYISSFLTGLNVTSWFDLTVSKFDIRTCGTGIELSPLTNGGDNGYQNNIYFTDGYLHNNVSYDVHVNPAIRVSNLNFTDCVFDPGATVQKIYLKTANPCRFTNCYWESATAIPAIYATGSSKISVDGAYCIGVSGFVLDPAVAGILSVKDIRVAGATEIINAPYSLHHVAIRDSSLPAAGNVLPADVTISNSTVNGVLYGDVSQDLRVGNLTTAISDMNGFTKSITATVAANSTTYLIYNQYVPGVFAAASMGVASFGDATFPGLILTVTPASTGSQVYFSVHATNTTGAAITITAKTLNVLIMRMTAFTAL